MDKFIKSEAERIGAPMHDAVAGAISGISSCIILQPLDVLKTRLQEASASPDRIRELWRGTLPTLIRNVPGTALYFYSLQRIRQWMIITNGRLNLGLQSSDGKLGFLANALAGGSSRIFAGFCFMPFTVLKVRFESIQFLETRSLISMIRNIYGLEGVRGLFKGFWVTISRDGPHSAIYLACYEAIRGSNSNLTVNSYSAVISAIIATIATQPLDTIKTRVQLSERDSVWMIVQSILRQQGFLGFYRGTFVRFLRKVFGSAITWTIYEELRYKN